MLKKHVRKEKNAYMIFKIFRKMVDGGPLTPMSTRGGEIAMGFQIETDSLMRAREKMQVYQQKEYPISMGGNGSLV